MHAALGARDAETNELRAQLQRHAAAALASTAALSSAAASSTVASSSVSGNANAKSKQINTLSAWLPPATPDARVARSGRSNRQEPELQNNMQDSAMSDGGSRVLPREERVALGAQLLQSLRRTPL